MENKSKLYLFVAVEFISDNHTDGKKRLLRAAFKILFYCNYATACRCTVTQRHTDQPYGGVEFVFKTGVL